LASIFKKKNSLSFCWVSGLHSTCTLSCMLFNYMLFLGPTSDKKRLVFITFSVWYESDTCTFFGGGGYRPHLWSSGQRSGFDPRHYQILWELVGLERVHSALWLQLRSYLKEKVAAPVMKNENTVIGDVRCWLHNPPPSIRESWRWLCRQAVVARSV
jgi:hypothetical protein